jgi:serine phosphatase RsbU (regulator of sigma subunit)
MDWQTEEVKTLTTLNKIIEILNRAVDVREVLQSSLADIVALLGLETGWIFLVDEPTQDRWGENRYRLAAYHNLPPALDINNQQLWEKGCDCQGLCNAGKLKHAYNEVRCSRLEESLGDRKGLAVHASVPLRAGEQVTGILNIAGPDWEAFTPQKLALLNNIGNQMGNSLERAHLFDLMREQRVEEQSALLELSNQLLGRLDMDDIIDYLVEVVPRLMQADACALMLPAADESFLEFRVAKGWSLDPVAERRQIPVDERSGPGTVMITQKPLIASNIEDRDPAPWAPDWVLAESFRGHAVIPLVAKGRSVGVMTINTRKPREWNADEVRFMQLTANQIALALETARLHEQEVARQRLEEELAVGRMIQLSLLPEQPPQVPGWEFAAHYQSARQVSGDFYDFYELPRKDGLIGILIADVVDKGVPAALFMALSRTVIRTMALSSRGPAAVLEKSNEMIINDSRASLFLTVIYAELERHSGRFCFANAGHNRPLWLHSNTGQCEELAEAGSLLAVMQDLELDEQEIWIEPGDALVLYTDGLTEGLNTNKEVFGEQRLKSVIEANSDEDAQTMLQAILSAVDKFAGESPLADDLTLIVVRRTAT